MSELPKAVIEPHRVLIDGQELPGIIADSAASGVVVLPGGHDKLNRVQVTFYCSEVTVTGNGATVKGAQSDE